MKERPTMMRVINSHLLAVGKEKVIDEVCHFSECIRVVHHYFSDVEILRTLLIDFLIFKSEICNIIVMHTIFSIACDSHVETNVFQWKVRFQLRILEWIIDNESNLIIKHTNAVFSQGKFCLIPKYHCDINWIVSILALRNLLVDPLRYSASKVEVHIVKLFVEFSVIETIWSRHKGLNTGVKDRLRHMKHQILVTILSNLEDWVFLIVWLIIYHCSLLIVESSVHEQGKNLVISDLWGLCQRKIKANSISHVVMGSMIVKLLVDFIH